MGNKFALLDLSSDDEEIPQPQEKQEIPHAVEEKPLVQREKEQQKRSWEIDAPEEPSTLFTRGKKKKQNKKKDTDGWTSIVWNRPRFVNDDEERKIKEEQIQESLALPTTPTYEPVDTGEHKTTVLAKEWAAKIQADLEKAEAISEEKQSKKAELSQDFMASLGKLSFFRKPMNV